MFFPRVLISISFWTPSYHCQCKQQFLSYSKPHRGKYWCLLSLMFGSPISYLCLFLKSKIFPSARNQRKSVSKFLATPGKCWTRLELGSRVKHTCYLCPVWSSHKDKAFQWLVPIDQWACSNNWHKFVLSPEELYFGPWFRWMTLSPRLSNLKEALEARINLTGSPFSKSTLIFLCAGHKLGANSKQKQLVELSSGLIGAFTT